MRKLTSYLILLFVVLSILSACSVAPHHAYEQDKKPENRRLYQGMQGYRQFVKDEAYLTNREQFTDCQRYLLAQLEHNANTALKTESLKGNKRACTGSQLDAIKKLEALAKSL